MPARLEGKIALVTGAGSGLGKAIALAVTREGASLVLGGRRAEPLEKTLREIADEGGTGLVAPGDVTRAADVRRMGESAVARFGRLDVLVNNSLQGLKKTGEYEALVRIHPLGFLGATDDVAHAAVYLASNEARWMTGVVLPVDGGISATM